MFDKKVNLLIIGAGKSGTTSLYHYLKQHKDVCFADAKEVGYFTRDKLYNQGTTYLHQFFLHYNNEEIIATDDTHLLTSVTAPQRVFDYNKDIKLLAILRNPVDRAKSAYHFAIRNGIEKPDISFLESLQLESKRLMGSEEQKVDFGYFYYGLYFKHLSNWLKFFKKENILLINYDQFKDCPAESLKKIFLFLNIKHDFQIDFSNTYNKSGKPRLTFLHSFIKNRDHFVKVFFRKILNQRIRSIFRSKVIPFIYELNSEKVEYLPLSKEEKEKTMEYFQEDLKLLEKEFGFKFSS